MQQKLYTLLEVSLILKVAKMTVYRYIKQWKIKAYKFWKQFRINESDLDYFLNSSSFSSEDMMPWTIISK